MLRLRGIIRQSSWLRQNGNQQNQTTINLVSDVISHHYSQLSSKFHGLHDLSTAYGASMLTRRVTSIEANQMSIRHTVARILERSNQNTVLRGLVVRRLSVQTSLSNSISRDRQSQLFLELTRNNSAVAAWQRLQRIAAARIRPPLLLSPSFSRIARAVSLATSKSVIVQRIAAVLLGEATLRGRLGDDRISHCKAADESLSQPILLSSQNSNLVNPLYTLASEVIEASILALRAAYLFFLFLPVILTGPFSDIFDCRFRATWLELVHRTLERAGPAFIKWGQWAATRPDLFPRDMCQQLSKMHTGAPSHSFATTQRIVEKAFGRPLSSMFDQFEEEPVASGSIAQVHKAVLTNRYPRNGLDHAHREAAPQTVAVKVRHPGVRDVIHRDFVIMNWAARAASMMPGLRWLRLEESVKQFAIFMMTQVDLAREAAQLSRFNYNFRHVRSVSFPRPVYPLVHPEVLVETFEAGQSVARYVERAAAHDQVGNRIISGSVGQDGHSSELEVEGDYVLSDRDGRTPAVRDPVSLELAELGCLTLLKMMLVDNFIHADLHPGNILVRMRESRLPTASATTGPNGNLKLTVKSSHPEIVLLDVGMTAELSPRYRANMVNFFRALSKRNGRDAAIYTLRFSSQQSCPDPQAFVDEVDASFRKWRESGRVPTGDCMQEILEQVRRHRVNIDGDVCAVIITTLVLESWQRTLDPNLRILDSLSSILFRSEMASTLSYTMESIMAP